MRKYRTEPYPPPKRDRIGQRVPDWDWAIKVFELWDEEGRPRLDGPPQDQMRVAMEVMGLCSRMYSYAR